jgi:Uma2 family endonuclease
MIIPEQAKSPKIVDLHEVLVEEQATLRALLEVRRPAWVPEYVGDDYDRDPYAYQTRQELMPEGANHNEVASDQIGSALRPYVAARGWYLMGDTFIVYAPPARFRKHRIAPDLFISRQPILPPHREYAMYDLEEPPIAVFEVTAPGSAESDRAKQRVYALLEVPLFVLVDIVDAFGNPRSQYNIEVRHLNEWGHYDQVTPNADGNYMLDELELMLRAEGQNLIFTTTSSGERLLSSIEMAEARIAAENRAQAESMTRAAAKQRVQQLMAELARLRNGERERTA